MSGDLLRAPKKRRADQAGTAFADPDAGYGPLLRATGGDVPLRQQVFETVRSAGRLPRIDVAKRLAVSPATVTQTVASLIAQGLLEEQEEAHRPGQRGRPPVALRVRADAVHVAGIKLSDEVHTGVIVDLAGHIVAEARLPRRPRQLDSAPMTDEAVDIFDALLAASGMARGDLAALGVGLPGVVDHLSGRVLWSPILTVRDVPLAADLGARLGLPVVIDNDANMLTLAELWYGTGRRLANFAVVTIEHGVGMGMVIQNQLYRGAHSAGLELGHMKVQLDGALCRCGKRGCLEAYVADYALVREAHVALDLHRLQAEPAEVTLGRLFDQAKAGDEAARTIFRRAGRFLALGLANVAALFDPTRILLSGERMQYDLLYAEEVLAEMRDLALDSGSTLPQVEINAWGDLVWARGAATLALAQVTETLSAQGEAS